MMHAGASPEQAGGLARCRGFITGNTITPRNGEAIFRWIVATLLYKRGMSFGHFMWIR